MNTTPPSVVNEVGRFLVDTSIDATSFQNDRLIAVVLDGSLTGLFPSLLANNGLRLRISAHRGRHFKLIVDAVSA
ncbi:MAG: hypothetical protein ABI580_14170 [Burkholderiaceae bacterium]